MPNTAPAPARIKVALADLIEMRHRVREVQLFARPGQRGPLVGLHHSRLRGRGVDFDQVRVYQAGDDVRNIDWRVTARTQEPHTKLFHEERERPVFLLVEQSRRLFFGSTGAFKSVVAARVAALMGWATLEHNDRVGGLVFGDAEHYEIKPRRSKQSLLQLLARLAQLNQGLSAEGSPEPGNFGAALRRAREVLRPGSLAIVLCDTRALEPTAEQQLSLLARHCDVLLLPVSDPLDHALPAAGLLRFAQGEQRLEVDTQRAPLRQAYAEQANERSAHWERLAGQTGILLLPLSTERDPVEQLRDYLNPPRAKATR
ncbi:MULTISPECIES: DUF58 domain-containing protein [unclassified Pseudomonas]|uniref:DUF58 domain-containing protein n=1 Tax=unclassified Pseudomonas TaxID=196821 RepID=UPI000BCF9CDF|nr:MULTISPECIES: DUF58 domain-containing protein [unclassified Pseudomonas]PVZ20330.1 uncharacterized protein DUF58 [Pseudomonas sp. URIL14HWK12:I12]PVZ27396.1 uncharacterized protein DUF58 [Pseudomonas sp. URIL14HWK12:I10]PVZ38285.1 uncharacterized protein DUF58 [Pseudomonas sp. URIL14HWK12:I11]SNZ03961.1 Uncharacterized conserved protein (some members contain a von Willebrand factor type A (vWA) domain) [Pseudomonas sp. URIL14HWK12:I9]